MDLGDRGQPFAGEQVIEYRPGEARLALVQIGAVVGVRDPVARAEGLQHRIHRPHAGDQQLADRRDAVQAGLVEQRLVVARRQRVASLRAVPRAGVELEDAAGGLLLQPLAYVAFTHPPAPRPAPATWMGPDANFGRPPRFRGTAGAEALRCS